METIQNILENSDLIRYLPTVIGPAVIATLEMVVLSAVLSILFGMFFGALGEVFSSLVRRTYPTMLSG